MKKATNVGLAADILSPTLAIRGLRRGMYWHLAQGCTYIYGNEQITAKRQLRSYVYTLWSEVAFVGSSTPYL